MFVEQVEVNVSQNNLNEPPPDLQTGFPKSIIIANHSCEILTVEPESNPLNVEPTAYVSFTTGPPFEKPTAIKVETISQPINATSVTGVTIFHQAKSTPALPYTGGEMNGSSKIRRGIRPDNPPKTRGKGRKSGRRRVKDNR